MSYLTEEIKTEQYSMIHKWNPAFKFLGLLGLIITFAFAQEMILVPAMLLISLVIYFLSGLKAKILVKRLGMCSFFIIGLCLFILLFSQGTALIQVGSLNITNTGLQNSLMIMARFVSIFTLVMVLVGTTQFTTLIHVLDRSIIPEVIRDIVLLTYRYIYVIGDNMRGLRISNQIRGFRIKGIRDLKVVAAMVGTIFVKSHQQAERTYAGMMVRGYSLERTKSEEYKAVKQDYVLLALSFSVICIMIIMEIGYLVI
jgi:cobalt/nickel transport system permease protein